MPKLKYSLTLPLLQLPLAAILWRSGDNIAAAHVPTPRLVCWGLSAPALLLRAQAGWGPLSRWLPASICGLETSEFLFLAGVVAVWFSVGWALDRRGVGSKFRWAVLRIVYPLLFALGSLLCVVGIDCWRNMSFNNANYPVFSALVWLWSASLIFISLRAFVRVVWRSTD